MRSDPASTAGRRSTWRPSHLRLPRAGADRRPAFAAVPFGLYRSSLAGKLLAGNPALAALLGVRDLRGRRLDDSIVDPAAARRRRETLGAGELTAFRYLLSRADGLQRWVEEDARVVRRGAGVAYCEGCLRDVTEVQRSEETLLALRRAIEGLPIGVTVTDTSGRILYANPAEARLRGYEPGELVGQLGRTLVPSAAWCPPEPDLVAAARPWKRERPNLRKDGSVFPAQLISSAVRDADGSVVGMVTTCEDIAERKASEEQLARSALHDALTGLPNRVLFRARLAKAWGARSAGTFLVVLFLDLDDFKRVNDSFGHAAGDAVLHEAAARLVATVRPEDTVARLGGDEFAILLQRVDGVDTARHVAERCRLAFERPFAGHGHEVSVGASVGIALSAARHGEAWDVLRDADLAMYRAKARGRMRCEVYAPGGRRAGGGQDGGSGAKEFRSRRSRQGTGDEFISAPEPDGDADLFAAPDHCDVGVHDGAQRTTPGPRVEREPDVVDPGPGRT